MRVRVRGQRASRVEYELSYCYFIAYCIVFPLKWSNLKQINKNDRSKINKLCISVRFKEIK